MTHVSRRARHSRTSRTSVQVAAALLFAVTPMTVLAGCAAQTPVPQATAMPVLQDSPTAKAIDAEALVASRHPYVGDNSKNAATLGALDLEAVGERGGMEILADERPYTLRLEFTGVTDGTDAEAVRRAMSPRAALALAMIENADRIEWRTPLGTDSLSREEAEKLADGRLASITTADEARDVAAVIDQKVGNTPAA